MDSRDYTSFGLDNHDIDDKVQKIAKSLLNSRTIKSQKEPKVLAIGAIDDETSDGIDTEIIATELIKHLSDSEKFLVVNAGRDKKVEEMIRDARNFRNDAEYNQYTTIEAGNLISPHYALTGKITERTKSVGEDEIKEYVFVFKLTDLTRGVVRWVGTERISKKLAKSEVENFQESKSYGTDYSKYLPDGYAPSYSYKPSYSQKDDIKLHAPSEQKEGGYMGVEVLFPSIGIISGYQWYYYYGEYFHLGLRLAGHLNYYYLRERHHILLLGIAPHFIWDFVNVNAHTLGLHLAPLGFNVRGIFNSKGVDFVSFYEFSAGFHYYYDINHQIYLTFRVFSNNIVMLGYAYKF